MTTALFIGRFQPLHKGHKHAIEQARKKYHVVVGIGSSEAMNTVDNPLSFNERRKIIHNCVPGVEIVAIPDQEANEAWLDFLDDRFSFDRGISGNSLVQELFASRGWPIDEPDFLRPKQYMGTNIRDRVAAGQDWTHLVPACSKELLDRFNFVERVKAAYEHS